MTRRRLLGGTLSSLAVATASRNATPAYAQPAWRLVWSVKFDGSANSALDPAKWSYVLGHGQDGWGVQELENYTNYADNVHLDGKGNLIIRAQGTASAFTSARLKTQGTFATIFGKIESCLRLPYGQGIWPAFWMLGADIEKAGWLACGEIDVMENIGREPSTNHGTLHGPGYSGGNSIGSSYTLPTGQKFSDDFYVFSIIWSAQAVEFFVDAASYGKFAPAALPPRAEWVFNKPFFFLLNVAVGGSWPGAPDDTARFPQSMTVDYVRVFETQDATRAQ